MKIGFIGLGNMATAIIGGILGKGIVVPADIVGSDKMAAARTNATSKFGISTAEDNGAVAKAADILFMAVKPQFFEEVTESLSDTELAGKTIISIAPGKTIAWLEERLGEAPGIVRCMPNTPALVGEGCSAVCFNAKVSEETKTIVMELIGSFGRASQVPERLMDVVTGVSGCAPAWVFMLIEAMADGGVAEGMPRSQAYEFASQAVLGSAKMVLETGKHPGELKDMVCSPAGSTIQAVKVLEEKNFRGAVMDAVIAGIEKSRQL